MFFPYLRMSSIAFRRAYFTLLVRALPLPSSWASQYLILVISDWVVSAEANAARLPESVILPLLEPATPPTKPYRAATRLPLSVAM